MENKTSTSFISTDSTYEIWIDGNLLPQTPSEISYQNEDRTETIELASDDYTIIQHLDGPFRIDFEFTITMKDYPYTFKDVTLRTPTEWANFLSSLKSGKKAVELVIIRKLEETDQDWYFKAQLTSFDYSEDAEESDDFNFSVEFVEFREWTNQELNTSIQHHLIQNRVSEGYRSQRGQRV